MEKHKLTTDAATRLGEATYQTYQKQLNAASDDVINLARILQENADVWIEGIAPLYINQATNLAKDKDVAARLAFALGRAVGGSIVNGR